MFKIKEMRKQFFLFTFIFLILNFFLVSAKPSLLNCDIPNSNPECQLTTQATIFLNETEFNVNNSDLLDGQHGSYYINDTLINSTFFSFVDNYLQLVYGIDTSHRWQNMYMEIMDFNNTINSVYWNTSLDGSYAEWSVYLGGADGTETLADILNFRDYDILETGNINGTGYNSTFTKYCNSSGSCSQEIFNSSRLPPGMNYTNLAMKNDTNNFTKKNYFQEDIDGSRTLELMTNYEFDSGLTGWTTTGTWTTGDDGDKYVVSSASGSTIAQFNLTSGSTYYINVTGKVSMGGCSIKADYSGGTYSILITSTTKTSYEGLITSTTNANLTIQSASSGPPCTNTIYKVSLKRIPNNYLGDVYLNKMLLPWTGSIGSSIQTFQHSSGVCNGSYSACFQQDGILEASWSGAFGYNNVIYKGAGNNIRIFVFGASNTFPPVSSQSTDVVLAGSSNYIQGITNSIIFGSSNYYGKGANGIYGGSNVNVSYPVTSNVGMCLGKNILCNISNSIQFGVYSAGKNQIPQFILTNETLSHTENANIGHNITTGELIKLNVMTLPACNSNTNGSIGRNITGVYGCGGDAIWRFLF